MATYGEELLLTGALILAAGTITAAIGQTQQSFTESDEGKSLVLRGNVAEAFGNSLQAVARTKFEGNQTDASRTFSILGSWLEAGGNVGNAIGMNLELTVSEEEGMVVDALGSGIQGVGASFDALGASLTEEVQTKPLEISGNIFFALGAFLESIGNLYLLNGQVDTGEMIMFAGSWIQVMGALVLVTAFTIALETEPAPEQENSLPYSYASVM